MRFPVLISSLCFLAGPVTAMFPCGWRPCRLRVCSTCAEWPSDESCPPPRRTAYAFPCASRTSSSTNCRGNPVTFFNPFDIKHMYSGGVENLEMHPAFDQDGQPLPTRAHQRVPQVQTVEEIQWLFSTLLISNICILVVWKI